MTQKHWKIYSQMKSLKKKLFCGGFIDNSQKLKNRKRHLSLRLLWFHKTDKKSMSISLQTYEKNGVAALFEIAVAAARSKLFWFLLKNIGFIMIVHFWISNRTESHEER